MLVWSLVQQAEVPDRKCVREEGNPGSRAVPVQHANANVS